MLRTILNNRLVFWAVLALPAIPMLARFARGTADAADLLHPTGETSARLMLLALALGPLVSLLGPRPWLNWLVPRRRYLGVAAFLYALLHLVFYLLDMGNLADMLAELFAPGIWTGWSALLLMLVPAALSNDASMRWLKEGWKRLQRLAYAAAILTLLHWVWVHNSAGPAFLHFLPLALLWALRFALPFVLRTRSQGVEA